ncbi:MAG: cobalamin-dependent protein [Bacillota bacterium]
MAAKKDSRKNEIKRLADLVADGQATEAVRVAENLLALGVDVRQVVEEGLTEALVSLDVKCNNDHFNLLEILLAGRAVMEVMEQSICPRLGEGECVSLDTWYKGKEVFVLGTIKGDIHDLGKNIVAILLKMAGYRVVDLGKDVEPEVFAMEAKKEGAKYIGISSLITTTMHYIKEVKPALGAIDLEGVLVLAGGGATRQSNPKDLNVDFVANTAFDVIDYLRKKEGV